MAFQARITDGGTTINLTSAGIYILEYPLTTPEATQDVIENLGDGDALETPTWRNVAETISLLITGANAAAVRDSIRSIEMLLDKTRQNRLTWRGARVWIEVQFDHDSSVWWRSEILAGRLLHKGIVDQLWKTKVETALIITRRPYWEGPETQLELSSAGTGSPTTNFATVYNDDDQTANTNWFQVAAAQVGGDLPAPLKLQIANNSGANIPVMSMHIGNYVHMDPTTIDPIMRGNQASFSDTSWSGTAENVCYRWLLPKALLRDLAGQYCRILVALSTVTSFNTLARIKLQYLYLGSYYDLAVGEQVKTNSDALLDLGALPLPPGGYGIGINEATYLTLTMQAFPDDPEQVETVVVDWIQVMPAGFGLYRHLHEILANPGMGLPNGHSLIDDGIEGLVYSVDAASDTYLSYRGIHAPLHVWPGLNNRFRLMKQGQVTLGAGATFGVKAWYRPRRLTI